MFVKPTQTVKQFDGKIVTFFTENKLWVKAYKTGKNAWERRNWVYAQKIVKSPDIVLDIGANIGQEMLYYTDWARRIISFEPNPMTFDVLKQNVDQNNIKNVELKNFGVGSSPSKAFINLVKNNEGRSFVTQAATKVSHEITIVAIDDLNIGEGKVDFVKMDVEGFEIEALNGMKNLIDKHAPVFQVEAQDETLERCGVTSVDIWDFFNQRGYVATINTGKVIDREHALTKDRTRVDLFFKKNKE
jgi:FkbM family methyltransferase